MIVPLQKVKGERTECNNYRGISLSVVYKTFAGMLVDKVQKVTEGLIDDVQRGFRSGSDFVDQIFILSKLLKKYMRKVYDSVNREAL